MTRAHGQSTGAQVAFEKGQEFDKPMTLDEEKPLNLTRAFQRLRTDWNSKDKLVIQEAQSFIDGMIHTEFRDAFAIITEVYMFVREPEVDDQGEVQTDQWGAPEWKRYPDGGFIEDWTRLSHKVAKEFIYKMAFGQFGWEQRTEDLKFEALIAKHRWEEAFSTAFDSSTDKATDKAKEAKAERLASDERYLAVCKSLYSKKAEAIVRSMDRIHQRLKDLMQ